ncbi:sulfotransferase domain-containing protein [Erythrobacter insulae]|uniref:Sulfotransferase domain-containing protein n=1 Tax=Erythrobacter insulae TaxID=2584124 RepID=A0A547PAF5_9SPHN|nr:sulfotransferase domain-containing protein [Erythrobacter insulae]TRD11129.1 sulfotransferase domain-containing protein [Erythrobacter insulae]
MTDPLVGKLPGRARSLEEYAAMMGSAHSGEHPNHRPYEPQDGDVFITSWAKSGTTFLQQMFHQLRTAHRGGDMDFDDISRMTPWDDVALMVDFDMTAPQVASPRGFKSHREYERLPTGMRYAVTLRDPKETFISFYRFINGWHLEPGSVELEEFLPFWMGGGPGGCDYFTHLLSWYDRRKEPDSLVMTYRWAVKNRSAAIARMAALIGVEMTPEIEALVLERTTREFMHDHKDKFDDAMVCKVLDEKCGIPATSDSSKVQSEGSDAKEVPQSVADAIDAMWAERVVPVTGHADFAALAETVDAEA